MNRYWCWLAQNILRWPCPWKVEAEQFFGRSVLVIFRVWDPILSLPVIATVILVHVKTFLKKMNRILSSCFRCRDRFLALILEDAKVPCEQRNKPKLKIARCVVPPTHSQWSKKENQCYILLEHKVLSPLSPLQPLTFTSNTDWRQLCRKGAILIIYSFLLLRREERGMGRRGSIPEV